MGMRRYVLARLGQLVVLYFVFLSMLFALFRLMPGNPTTLYVMSGQTAAQRQEVIERLGLNEPLHVQFVSYLQQMSTGDFGTSFSYSEPVFDVIVVKFWNTVFLMGVSLLLAFLIGVYGGAILAWYRGTTGESFGVVVGLISRSTPVFFTGIVLVLLFAIQFQLFPPSGMSSPGVEHSSFWDRYLSMDFIYHAVLPVATATISFFSLPMLLMRNTMLEVLDADFIELKRAEGLSNYTLVYRHAARNSILPIVTVGAIVAGSAIGGSAVLETVFDWPGMGRAMVEAVYSNDYPLAMTSFFLMGVLVMFANFVADILYAYLDPRITYD